MSEKRSRDHKRRHKYGTDSEESKSRSRSRSPPVKDEKTSPSTIKQEPKCVEVKEERKPDNVGLAAKNRLKSLGIQMKLNAQRPSSKPKMTVAAAFNQDSDDEPEEMPREARMRMRNIGRDTPTSSGPNSFGKTKQGFSDAKKVFERNLKEAMDKSVTNN